MSLSKMEMWVVAGAVCGRGRSDRKNVKLSISGDRAPLGLSPGCQRGQSPARTEGWETWLQGPVGP